MVKYEREEDTGWIDVTTGNGAGSGTIVVLMAHDGEQGRILTHGSGNVDADMLHTFCNEAQALVARLSKENRRKGNEQASKAHSEHTHN